MKEVTYEDWKKNPTPRMMWVWDEDITHKIKAEVVYCCDATRVKYPVVTLSEGIKEGSQCLQVYKHCAEIEEAKTRRMTNQELAWWLQDGKHREWCFRTDKDLIIRTYFDYSDSKCSMFVNDNVLIRENSGKWREPLVEVEE